MTGRLLSFNYFVLDSCLLALPLLFLAGNADVPPGILFLGLSMTLGLLTAGLLMRWTYHPAVAGVASLTVMSAVFLTGSSVFLYALFVLISFQRLHARFSEQQDEFDGNFLLLFLFVFSGSLFAILLWGETDRLAAFYSIAFFTLLFFVISRLLYRYLAASSVPQSALWKVGSLLVVLPVAGAFLFYTAADWIRVLLGTVIGGILFFVLQPFDGLMGRILKFLERISLEPRERKGEVLPPDPPTTATGDMTVLTPAFPYEWIGILAIVITVTILIIWLKKWRPEKGGLQSSDLSADVHFGTAVPEERAVREEKVDYSAADLPFIRETFREFEWTAAEYGAGRQDAETVREWFNRMGWSVPAQFYRTYDSVRYGNRNIHEKDAQAFLKEIDGIKNFFSK